MQLVSAVSRVRLGGRAGLRLSVLGGEKTQRPERDGKGRVAGG